MTGPRLLGMTGTVTVEMTGACPEDCLSRLAAGGVRFRRFHKTDELTIRMVLSDRDLPVARRCAKKSMCTLKVIGASGLIPMLRAMGMRALYPVVLLAMLLLVFWLQSHIWFFTVTGNETVPTEKILWVLEENGIHFWTKTASLDMNTLKNQVLEDLPELGWITINTSGGTANVTVRERVEKPVISRSSAPANVVAKKSGLITNVEVTGGTAEVKKGDVIAKGDLLISGVTNLDKTLLLTRAEGEVYARTWNRMRVVFPDTKSQKVYSGNETVRYCLTIGKKTINFYKTSGISYSNYDKIVESTRLTLPGGYEFPICLSKVTYREYAADEAPVSEADARALMERAASDQLQQELTAGEILASRLKLTKNQNGFLLTGVMECREEIGSVVEIKD